MVKYENIVLETEFSYILIIMYYGCYAIIDIYAIYSSYHIFHVVIIDVKPDLIILKETPNKKN